MDLCYFLSAESQANDWELRFSLRSWWRHYPALGNIHIVGHLPEWLIDSYPVTHHDLPDPYRANKDANLIQKTIYLATRPEVSDPFILCSDDQFLLRPAVTAELSPPRHHGEIAKCKKQKGHSWWERLHRTGDALRRRKCPTFHYDTHIPHVVTKDQARALLRWNYGEGGGYCVFSLLFNGSHADGVRVDSGPIRAGLYGCLHTPEAVRAKMASNLFLSIDGDSLRCRPIVEELEGRFPDRAPWERDEPRSPLDYETLYPEAVDVPCSNATPSPLPTLDYSKYLVC